MTRVKVCGITNLKDALAAVKLGANALGFVFYKKSPRYVSPQKAKKIIEMLPSHICCVGVFVDEKEIEVKRIARYCGLDCLQFHGNETPQYCRRFKGYRIIKAFRVKDRGCFNNILRFKVDAYLFDSFEKGRFGGTGKIFNWRLLNQNSLLKKHIILSGGLNPRNIQKAIKKVMPFAVDISSGIEVSPGIKSHKLMKELFSKISQINSSPDASPNVILRAGSGFSDGVRHSDSSESSDRPPKERRNPHK